MHEVMGSQQAPEGTNSQRKASFSSSRFREEEVCPATGAVLSHGEADPLAAVSQPTSSQREDNCAIFRGENLQTRLAAKLTDLGLLFNRQDRLPADCFGDVNPAT